MSGVERAGPPGSAQGEAAVSRSRIKPRVDLPSPQQRLLTHRRERFTGGHHVCFRDDAQAEALCRCSEIRTGQTQHIRRNDPKGEPSFMKKVVLQGQLARGKAAALSRPVSPSTRALGDGLTLPQGHPHRSPGSHPGMWGPAGCHWGCHGSCREAARSSHPPSSRAGGL